MSVTWQKFGDVFGLERRAPGLVNGEERTEIGLKSFGRGAFHKPAVSLADLGTKRVFGVREGDLLISNIFAWEGAIAIAGPLEEGLIGSHRFMTWVPKQSNVYVSYVRDYLLTVGGLEAIGKASPGSAGRNRTLGVQALKQIEIPLPDLDTQREIAARLDSISRVLASIGPSTDNDLARARERRVLEAIAGAPKRAIGEVVELDRVGVAFSDGELYRPIGVRSFGRGLIEYPATDADGLSKLTYFELPGDALVVSNIKAWEGAVTHYPGGKELITSSRFLCYTAKTHDTLTAFLAEYFKTTEGTAKLAAASPGSADRNRTLGRSRFEQIHVPVPDLEAQRTLLTEVKRFDELERTHVRRLQLVDALLPAARNEEFRKLLAA